MRIFYSGPAALFVCAITTMAVHPAMAEEKRPNIIVIMSDDVGFSDIGCFGGEIETPNLDKLASEGVRFTQFYNQARCCPSRASLLTGVAAHQAGVGHMLRKTGYPGYSEQLSTDTVTMAEVLKDAGYRTYMTGKWHVARSIAAKGAKDAWPMQRGFEKYYGIITGASSYYDPATLCRGNKFITVENDPEYKPEKYYFTDAIADNSIKFIDEHKKESPDKPFFMYVAFTAAHWPLHAPEDELARTKGKYDAGYDAIRQARLKKMKELGIIPDDLQTSETVGDWEKVENKPWEARTMETYAAMLHRMDTGIGRIVEKLKAEGQLDNTIIMYMQDNGACAETIGRETRTDYATDLKPMGPDDLQTKIWPPMQTRDGRPVKTGTDVMAGAADTYNSYGENWANVSNTPFRFYKHWSHEGGIATPLIIHWPAGVIAQMKNQLVDEPGHLIDVMATVVQAGGAKYPAEYKGNKIAPLAGVSLLPLVQGQRFDRGGPLFWEHENNRAVRDGQWKIVTNGKGPWELYDMDKDRGELKNVAAEHPDVVKKMSDQWDEWAKKNDVLPLGAWEESTQSDHPSQDFQSTQSVFALQEGESLSGDKRPAVAEREISVMANVTQWGNNGVLVSQGGSRIGYALYSKNGKAGFAIRNNSKLTFVETADPLETGKPIRLNAKLGLDGTLSLKAGLTDPVSAKSADGALLSTPVEGVTVGSDPEGKVGEYATDDTRFNGKINRVVIRVSKEGEAMGENPVKRKGKKPGANKGKRGKAKAGSEEGMSPATE